MNYRDKIRKAIECPQFGNDHYGEWGALRLDQRRYIKRLLDELDGADAYILQLYEENQQLKEQQKEFIDYLDNIILHLEKDINYYEKNYTPTGKYLKETRTNQYNQLLQIKVKYEEIIGSNR